MTYGAPPIKVFTGLPQQRAGLRWRRAKITNLRKANQHMTQQIILILFWLLTALAAFTTLAPLSESHEWWIRGWDFPRLHIAIGAGLTAIMGIFVMRPSVAFATALLISCCIYQSYRIFPYTQWATAEIAVKADVPTREHVSIISSNVLMGNQDHAAVAAMIEREQPDLLFLMETDQVWEDALSAQLSDFETVISYPLDNHYGLIFATNLYVHSAEVKFLTDDETPSILADLEGPTGQFFFVGLHPRPPVPGQDTEDRDAQIRRAALLADRETHPVVAMGDFNDVAWSRTSEKFKEYGQFNDPRIGRGLLPSFDANSWWMRFPIDQLYLTDGLDLISFGRLDAIGSDHFPMKAVVSVAQLPADD